jgi:hypothetical protein
MMNVSVGVNDISRRTETEKFIACFNPVYAVYDISREETLLLLV